MKIMVFDVPAEIGGALTVLLQYYDKAISDIYNDWIFIISTPTLKKSENVTIKNFPWVKRSWIHRLYFDWVIAPKLVRDHEIDAVISLQNITIPRIQVNQTLYLHQALPFTERKFRITENFKFWVYQNIIGKMIIQSIRRADTVIVQTQWIQNAAIIKSGTDANKFKVEPPSLSVEVKKKYRYLPNRQSIFFYPSSAFPHKNHETIINACLELLKSGISDYSVIFTITGDENKHILEMKRRAIDAKLPIEFIGHISTDEVYEYYSKSILLFPSYVESFGLPLLEARAHGCPIIASDCSFAHEILNGHEPVSFFSPTSAKELQELMRHHICQQIL